MRPLPLPFAAVVAKHLSSFVSTSNAKASHASYPLYRIFSLACFVSSVVVAVLLLSRSSLTSSFGSSAFTIDQPQKHCQFRPSVSPRRRASKQRRWLATKRQLLERTSPLDHGIASPLLIVVDYLTLYLSIGEREREREREKRTPSQLQTGAINQLCHVSSTTTRTRT